MIWPGPLLSTGPPVALGQDAKVTYPIAKLISRLLSACKVSIMACQSFYARCSRNSCLEYYLKVAIEERAFGWRSGSKILQLLCLRRELAVSLRGVLSAQTCAYAAVLGDAHAVYSSKLSYHGDDCD